MNIIYRAFRHDDWSADIIFEVRNDKIKGLELMKTQDLHISEEDIRSAVFNKIVAEKEILNTHNEFYETHVGNTGTHI
ncbi:MAG: hypothetical protein JSW28_07705 [Thermoplasmata archaeon]|nr:MAG: hypothetical protein JSW28_07705 [Thermoplasmata archaeon]